MDARAGWHSADHALRDYDRLMRCGVGARAQNVLEGRFVVWARSCARCGTGSRVTTTASRGDAVERCRRCGTPWRGTVVYQTRNAVQSAPRRDAAHEPLLALGILGRMFDALERERRTIWWLHVVGSRSYESAAVEVGAVMRSVYRVAPAIDWTLKRARGAVAYCRREIEAQLSDRGMLSSSVESTRGREAYAA